MSTHEKHPSFLQIDKYYVESRSNPLLGEDVDDYEKYHQHIEALNEPIPIPDWVYDLNKLEKGETSYWSTRWFLSASMVAVASVCLGLLVQPVIIKDEIQYSTTRGGPSVVIYFQRDDHTKLWDGLSPFVNGDSIRLKILPDNYQYIAVLSGKQVLYNKRVIPFRENLLPKAWSIDGQDTEEKLKIILGEHPIEPKIIEQIQDTSFISESYWVKDIILPR